MNDLSELRLFLFPGTRQGLDVSRLVENLFTSTGQLHEQVDEQVAIRENGYRTLLVIDYEVYSDSLVVTLTVMLRFHAWRIRR